MFFKLLDTAKLFRLVSRIKIYQLLVVVITLLIVVNLHPKVVFVRFEIKSRLLIDTLLFLLAFRALFF
jgi:hypothetical protein